MTHDIDEESQLMDAGQLVREKKAVSVQEIDSQYLPAGESYNLYLCMSRAKDAIEYTGRAFMELGQQLMLIKAHETSEQFHAAIENLNISWRTANYAMSAARKFSNSQALANFSRASLIALTVLDDDQAEELNQTGKLDGLGTASEIKEMTYRELQKALQDMRNEKAKLEEEHTKQIEAVENVVRKKESKISELEMEVAGKQPPTKEELAEQSLKEIRKQMIIRFSSMNAELDELNRLLARAQETEGVTVDQLDSLADGVGEFYSLFDDKYQDFNQDMENIRPMRRE